MNEKKKIGVMVVDDHFIVRVGLTASVNAESDMMIVGEAGNGRQAVELHRQLKPDVTLMDLRLPGMSGTEAIAAIHEESPKARIIAVSTYDGDEDIYRALQAGARAYLLKDIRREELLDAIRAVHQGLHYIPKGVAAQLASRLPQSELSPRELEVLELIVKGYSNREVAAALSIREVTIKIHVTHILEKLGVRDRTQAVASALQRGIIHLE